MAFSYAPAVVCVAVTILLAVGFAPTKGQSITALSILPSSGEVRLQMICNNNPYLVKSNLQLNVPSNMLGGVIWASQTANSNNGQATQIEFTINANGQGRDFYDISILNAYNLPAMVNATSIANGDVPSGLECGSPVCVVPDLNSVCMPNNFFAGPDPCCVNADGPGLQLTPGIQLFQNQCPTAYV